MNDQRYPLQWPNAKPRTPNGSRQFGRFVTRRERAGRGYKSNEPVTLSEAIKRLQDELDRLGAADFILSTNVALRLDGLPRGGQSAPADPGACVYFKLKGKAHALPCDRFTKVEQNIAAIAAHIEATRAIERYGVADMGELFRFAALPAPGQDTARGWRTVLGFDEGDRPSAALIEKAYRKAASMSHPDKGGSDARMAEVNTARDQAMREVGA